MVITRQAKIAPRGRFSRGRFTMPSAVEEHIEVRSPNQSAEILGVFPCGAEDAAEVVGSAVDALASWRALTLEARLEVLARVQRPLLQRSAELAVRMHSELGRPPWECTRELDGLVPRLRDLCALAQRSLGDEAHGRARIRHRPLGVVVVLGPVMLPIATSHTHILAALIAGNTVVWKPSPLSAASAQLYMEALQAAGLPPGVVNLIQGGASVGQQLLAHPKVDAAVFTGSREHAHEIRQATSNRFDLTMMFHVGAKNPAVVLENAALITAAAEIAQGAYLSAGQRCTATSRVLVQASVLDGFLDALAATARRIRFGRSGASAFMGPMFSRERQQRFLQHLATAELEGAVPVLRPEARPDLCVGPSIHLVENPASATEYREMELFGPDVVVEPVADLADAVRRLDRTATLYASLFSADVASWQRFQRNVESGALLWNHSPVALSGRLSFASTGREHANRGPHALLAMTRRSAHCDAPTGAPLPSEVLDLVDDAAPGLEKRSGS